MNVKPAKAATILAEFGALALAYLHPARKNALATSGAKPAEKILATTGSNLNVKKKMPPKTANTKTKPASVDTSAENIFWGMLPFSAAQKSEGARLENELPKSEYRFENWPAIIQDLKERANDALVKGDSLSFSYAVRQLKEAESNYYREKYSSPYGKFDFLPKEFKKPLPEPRSAIHGLRLYWHLKSGKRASGRLVFKEPLPETNVHLGIEMYIDGKTIAVTLSGCNNSLAIITFGYWLDENTFRQEDYSSFFPRDYPGVFKVVNKRVVAQYGGRYYYEVKLTEV